MPDKLVRKNIAANRAAYHEYYVIDSFEAGIELFGTEVKSIRNGRVNLKDSFCRIDDGELIAYGIHISPYEKGNIFNRDPYRPRKLLMHRREIDRLFGQVGQKGFSIIPLAIMVIVYQNLVGLIVRKFGVFARNITFAPQSMVFAILIPIGLGIGVGIGLIGSFFSIRKHLKV